MKDLLAAPMIFFRKRRTAGAPLAQTDELHESFYEFSDSQTGVEAGPRKDGTLEIMASSVALTDSMSLISEPNMTGTDTRQVRATSSSEQSSQGTSTSTVEAPLPALSTATTNAALNESIESFTRCLNERIESFTRCLGAPSKLITVVILDDVPINQAIEEDDEDSVFHYDKGEEAHYVDEILLDEREYERMLAGYQEGCEPEVITIAPDAWI